MTKNKSGEKSKRSVEVTRADYALSSVRAGDSKTVSIEKPKRVAATMRRDYAARLIDRIRSALADARGNEEVELQLDLPVVITIDVKAVKKLMMELEDGLP